MEDNTIWVETMVASQTGEPKVILRWYDHSGELTPAEARAHALHILEAAEAAESDALLYAFGKEGGMSRTQQAGLVHHFRNFREAQRKKEPE